MNLALWAQESYLSNLLLICLFLLCLRDDFKTVRNQIHQKK